MTTRAAPICLGCKHLSDDRYPDLKCAAFPSGVPDAIRDNEADHRQHYIGDHGIVFQPKTLDDDRYASLLFDVEPSE